MITPLVLTWNEELNIGRCLEGLTWAERVVVIDSGSTDGTAEILSEFPNTKLLERKFDTHADQWNFGLKQVKTEWVLSLDADYAVTTELLEEIKDAENDGNDGFFIPFRYCIHGHPLQGTLLPPRLALFRRSKGTYVQDGHTQQLKLVGRPGRLRNPLLHDDRKPFSRWLQSQDKYMVLEAEKLTTRPHSELSRPDRIRKMILPAPFLVAIHLMFMKGLLLDGWHGWYYVFQRALAEMILSLRLIEKKIR